MSAEIPQEMIERAAEQLAGGPGPFSVMLAYVQDGYRAGARRVLESSGLVEAMTEARARNEKLTAERDEMGSIALQLSQLIEDAMEQCSDPDCVEFVRDSLGGAFPEFGAALSESDGGERARA